jgi:survival-of-motor-neuron-related-splicing factor 30
VLFATQLESVEAALKTDPGNPELESLIKELQEVIELTQAVLAEQNGGHHHSNHHPDSSNNTPVSRHDHSNHPVVPPEGGVGNNSSSTYAVGDNVLARWTSGDNQLYPARITSVTGSHKNPVYLVKFTQYNVTEQLYPKDIKPAGNANKKRKLDLPATSAFSAIPTAATPNGAIISQPAAINAEIAEARRDQKEGDLSQKPAKKGRKLEQKKVLEAGQKKWQDFAAKGVRGKLGKSKKIGEASMFRTPESVHGRGTSTFFIWPFMSYG